jgi:tRNA dimethylallyltransferase
MMLGRPKIPVILLFGPTASGKTELLESLCLKQGKLVAEVVSADSMQVYKGMDIGTAKPTKEYQELIPHHLIDEKTPDEPFCAGDFVRLADKACVQIAARGRVPILCGGTGFYLKNFVQGLPEAPLSDLNIRNNLKAELDRDGPNKLMDRLESVDPISAARIHINDHYRILRALEVFESSGKPLSSYAQVSQEDDVSRPEYKFMLYGLRRSRENLYSRINSRTNQMFSMGLENEIRDLFHNGYAPPDPGMRAIGYQEFFTENELGNLVFLPETVNDSDKPALLETIERLIARNSRRYAKRQETFFTSLPNVHWLDAEHRTGQELAEHIPLTF